jgi:ribosomal protein S18 acetylase RimI-like enzyme
MTVRPLTPEDVPRVAALQVAAWRVAFAGILSQEALACLSVGGFEATWKEILTIAERTNLVVDRGEGAIGFVAFGPERGEHRPRGRIDAEVYGLYVDPEHWGERLGATLMQAALDQLRRERLSRVSLWVMSKNDRARRFYEHAGFAPTGRGRSSERAGCTFQEIEYAQEL